MPKAKRTSEGCQHDGDIFPKDDVPRLEQDPIIGWVTSVRCGKCSLVGVAKVDCENIDWDDPEDEPGTNKRLVKLYGPFTEIWRGKEADLLRLGKHRYLLTITSYDVPYRDLPKEDRPSNEELKERGETKKNYSENRLFASVGHHVVNVEYIFQSSKPMPENLTISNFEFDEYLGAP